jgi:hypothetical protein
MIAKSASAPVEFLGRYSGCVGEVADRRKSEFLWRSLELNRWSRDIGRRSDCLFRIPLGTFCQFRTMRSSQMGVPPNPAPGG